MFGSALWVCDAAHLEFLVMLGCSCVDRFSEFIVLRVVEDLFFDVGFVDLALCLECGWLVG